jgi:RNA methyltransferase, TrmH family
MLSKVQINFIKQLHSAKKRKETGLFIAEGEKLVNDFLQNGLEVHSFFTTKALPNSTLITEKEMARITGLNNASTHLLIASQFNPLASIKDNEWLLALDGIQDPGNLGTIIRTAAWFGINQIACSYNTADVYNQKTIHASMGALAHVKLGYFNLETVLKPLNMPKLACTMEGEPLPLRNKQKPSCIIIGSEGQGITESIKKLATQLVSIKKIGNAESLNAAVAAGIAMQLLKAQ